MQESAKVHKTGAVTHPSSMQALMQHAHTLIHAPHTPHTPMHGAHLCAHPKASSVHTPE